MTVAQHNHQPSDGPDYEGCPGCVALEAATVSPTARGVATAARPAMSSVSFQFPPPAPLMSMNDDPLVEFIVKGEPMSKARARVVNGHAFTPERTRVAEAHVQAAFLATGKRWQPQQEAGYYVEATFAAATRQRRDIDNMFKLILDALNGIAWVDDTQVVELHGRKILVPKGAEHTEVRIYSRPPLVGMQTTCEHCGKKMRAYPSLAWRWCSLDCRNGSRADARRRTCKGCGVEFVPETEYAQRVYCTLECKHRSLTVDLTCLRCGTVYNRPQSWATNGRPLCTPECRAAYWREHRAVAARGTCVECGGSTSKKSYKRCRACCVKDTAA